MTISKDNFKQCGKQSCIMLLFFLTFLEQTLYAQPLIQPITQDNLKDNSLGLQTHPVGDSYCVYAIFNKLNNTSFYFQDFMCNKMKLRQLSDKDYYKWNGDILTIKTTYTPPILFGNVDASAYLVYVQYSVFEIEKAYFVEKLDIWGNWESVAEIFVSYYPTKINIDYLKNNKTEIVTRYGSDRAVFSSKMVNGRLVGRITVRNEEGKNYTQFIKEYELRKQKFSANLDIQRKDSIKKEEEKLQEFIIERQTKVYNLSENNKKAYDKLLSQIQNTSDAFLNYANTSSSFYIRGTIKIEIDTNNFVRFNTKDVVTDNQEQLSNLIEKLRTSIKTEAQQINGHFVNSEILFNINISYQIGRAFFKIDKSQNIVFSAPYPTDEVQNEIKKKFQYYIAEVQQFGDYEVKYEVFSSVNMQSNCNSTKSNISIIEFKK